MTQEQTQPAKPEFECKHALYFPANDGSQNDLLLIKEYEYPADGGPRKSRLRQVYNHKRPYWITKPIYRNHKDKKEWEKIENLQRFESTEIGLAADIMRKLDRIPSGRMDLRQIAQSPYVYGIDVNSCVLTKHHYLTKWPHRISDNRVAVVDTETDMLIQDKNQDGYEEIILASITMKERARLVVVRKFYDGMPDEEIEKQLREKFQRYLGDIEVPDEKIKGKINRVDLIAKRNITLEIAFVNNAGEAAKDIIETAHAWSPDILAFWNIDFDMNKMIQAMEKRGYDLAKIFSDPAIPKNFQQFHYKQGPSQKVTASGKTMALAPAERWHEVICPASWYALDAMCVYLKLRIAGGKEPSYALDDILQKKLGIRKLKFKEADHLTKASWHKFMQMNHKIEYAIYNLFDCISVEMLDEKTTDLQSMISLMCAHSEYRKFPSQPRRTCDDLHFEALENGMVCAATSNKMMDDNDQHVVSINDWIVTLRSDLVEDDGLCLFEDVPNLRSYVRAHVADLDVEGTYPNVEIIMNISKETTAQELCYIQNVPEIYRRAIGVNLSGGFVNAVEICMQVYGAPSFNALLAEYDAQQGEQSVVNSQQLDAAFRAAA